MGCCAPVHESTYARENAILQEFAKEHRSEPRYKIVLLGSSQSGKSTFLKQLLTNDDHNLTIIDHNDTNKSVVPSAYLDTSEMIQSCLISQIQRLLYPLTIKLYIFKATIVLPNDIINTIVDYTFGVVNKCLATIDCAGIDPTQQATIEEIGVLKINKVTIANINKCNTTVLSEPDMMNKLRDQIKGLLLQPQKISDSDYSSAPRQLSEYFNIANLCLELNFCHNLISYFLNVDTIDRILNVNYIASFEDILMNYYPTTGVRQVRIKDCNDYIFDIHDCGGSRYERKKWIHLFENVQMFYYFMSLIDYSFTFAENDKYPATNGYVESFKLFETLCKMEYLSPNSFIVIVNKGNLLKQRLRSAATLNNNYNDNNSNKDSNSEAVELVNVLKEYINDQFDDGMDSTSRDIHKTFWDKLDIVNTNLSNEDDIDVFVDNIKSWLNQLLCYLFRAKNMKKMGSEMVWSDDVMFETIDYRHGYRREMFFHVVDVMDNQQVTDIWTICTQLVVNLSSSPIPLM